MKKLRPEHWEIKNLRDDSKTCNPFEHAKYNNSFFKILNKRTVPFCKRLPQF